MAQAGTHHEMDLRSDETQIGSERAFGITFAVVFGLVALYLGWHGREWAVWIAAGAVSFLAAAFLVPVVLRPLNRAWFRFGMLLHQVTTPIILGLLFFVTFVPIGLALRAFGKRPLQLGPVPRARTYWVERKADEPPSSLTNQF